MPLDRFVLIVVAVIVAAAMTVWIAAALSAVLAFPGWSMLALIPVALVAYVLVRVIAERAGSEEDDRYDRVER